MAIREVQTKEQRIAQHRHVIVSELEELRQATAKFSCIDGSGSLKVRECPELTDLQARIKGREQALSMLDSASSRIAAALKEANVTTIEELQEKRRTLIGVIDSSGPRAWDKFRLLRELPVASGGYPHLLPSELCKIDSYRTFEQAVKSERDQAQKELKSVSSLVDECAALAVTASSV